MKREAWMSDAGYQSSLRAEVADAEEKLVRKERFRSGLYFLPVMLTLVFCFAYWVAHDLYCENQPNAVDCR